MCDFILQLINECLNVQHIEKSKMKLSDRIRLEKTIVKLEICRSLIKNFLN